MSGLHCAVCKSESVSSSREIDTFKRRNLLKLFQFFERNQEAKLKELTPAICENCFYNATVAYNQTNVSSQMEPGTFILIINEIPNELVLEIFSNNRLRTIFGQYNQIYLGEIGCKSRNFAQITYHNESASSNTWGAIENRIKEICGNRVTLTLLAENDSPIDILSDDCLRRIFLFLGDIDDQINVNQVCQRWGKIAPIILDYRWQEINIEKWEKILVLSKKSLKEIHIDVSEYAERRFKAVENNCDNLEKLQIRNFNGSTEEIEKYMKPLLAAKLHLRKLSLMNVDRSCNFSFLNNLTEHISEIYLYAGGKNSTRIFSHMDFSKLHNLRVLQLLSFEFNDENSLFGLENLVNLEHFSLFHSIVHSSTFEKMQNFKKLKYLKIPSLMIHDDILSIIIKNNQDLEYLDISNNPNKLNNTLRMIGELPKLNSLIMKNLHDLDGSPLSKLHKLKYLNCRGCSSITDWELMTLINFAPNLNWIDATDCNVTLLLLVCAEEAFKKPERRGICIFVEDPGLISNWSKISNKSDKVHVFMVDGKKEDDEYEDNYFLDFLDYWFR